jgi:hypothetical protein
MPGEFVRKSTTRPKDTITPTRTRKSVGGDLLLGALLVGEGHVRRFVVGQFFGHQGHGLVFFHGSVYW